MRNACFSGQCSSTTTTTIAQLSLYGVLEVMFSISLVLQGNRARGTVTSENCLSVALSGELIRTPQGFALSHRFSAPDQTKSRNEMSLGTNLLFSELDVDEEKDDAHEEADGADGDVGDAEEGVPPAEQRRRGDDHALGTAELLHSKSLENLMSVNKILVNLI